jgi:ribonuclease D
MDFSDTVTVPQVEREPLLCRGDLDEALISEVKRCGVVGWDIETSGLDFHSDKIGTCQLHVPTVGVIVVTVNGVRPEGLASLLEDPNVTKVFHHAPFDVRFMLAQWGARATSVKCTKIASKLVFPDLPSGDHSLQELLLRVASIKIEKGERLSNWMAESLSSSQIAYAADDVQHLLPLIDRLESLARDDGILKLLRECFEHIPVRAELDVRGYADVFSY